MPSKSLRQRVIARIKREGLDMRFWTPADAKQRGNCGTSCCLAGNIGLELGLVDENTSAFRLDEMEIRAEWAKHYGQEEANRLDFYHNPNYGSLEEVTPAQITEHLMSIRSRKGSSRKKHF